MLDTAGFVLAGGASRRMGSSKADLVFQGETLLSRIASQVREAAGHVAIVGESHHLLPQGYAVIPDLHPGCGPVGAILTALKSVYAAEWNLVTACDMPSLDTAFLRELMSAAQQTTEAAVVPKTSDGRLHPLCAVYRRSISAALASAAARGEWTLRHVLQNVRVHYMECDRPETLRNVNTPEEWNQFVAGAAQVA